MNSITRTVELRSLPTRLTPLLGDRVILLLLALFIGLALLDTTQAQTSLRFTLEALLTIAPYFALAVGIAGYAKATSADKLIAKAFSGNPGGAIIGASLVGALSPFCSCGVVPLIAAMLAAGVPLAPVMAFCIASPIMDPEMFILTAAGISFDFAVAKTIITVAMGLLAGFAVLGLQQAGFLLNPLKTISSGCCQPRFGSDAKVVWRFWQEPERRQSFWQEIRQNGWFLGKWLSLAFFLESLMVAYIPAGWIVSWVGNDNSFAIPLATLVGVPSYLNGYAAIPLVTGLLDMGMAPGAAMAFVTAGAVSSIPAAVAVYALVRKPVFGVYIVLGLVGSLLAGYAYQFLG